ncbi:MAG: DNA topoisomerase IB [Aeromicrobium sp.]|uniref:DNA topoisomerase IB n=1 Tax=Aeromicrobium sp. TaxID=1871063 RepID=UPI0025BC71B0|nr:DNA topoisomerase IB [Aeromicrobium sp.]MCK5892290.1 DNA topoisomerase IB [Aeromicrobium sp.]MDF1704626.1 DNA topoisomerase IB [Aeromicrobium sp.]
MVRLRRVSPDEPGWSRVRHGRGFRYLGVDGVSLTPVDVERCKRLVIPPAWTEVWICPFEHGHLQAVGTDDAGRRQYLYHEEWRRQRDAEKFASMESFARSLLRNRRVARHDLGRDEPDLTRACAVAFGLLDLGLFRIGNEQYRAANGSHGLTTLDRDHVTVQGQRIALHYPGKSGQVVDGSVRDERLADAVCAMLDRDGGSERAFAWRDEDAWHDLDSATVNAYVADVLGPGFTAKNFRTWRGTVIAARSLALADASTATARKRAISAAMKETAGHLGNTPAVARSSYVDPRVVDLFEQGITLGDTALGKRRRISPGAPVPRVLERSVLRLLRRSA